VNVIHIGCDPVAVALGGGPTPCEGGRCSTVCPSYVTIGSTDGKLIIDARNAGADAIEIGNSSRFYNPASTADRDIAGTGPHHLRFVGVEVRNAGLTLSPSAGMPGAQGVLMLGDYNEFEGMNFHDNGAETTNHDHAIYLTGKRNVFRNCEIHHNTQGIQVWSNNNGDDNAGNVFDGLIVHDNGRNPSNGHAVSGSLAMGSGIGIYCGTGNVVQNSVFYGNYQGGIYVGYGSRDTVISGNTVHDNNASPETTYSGWGGIGVTNETDQCGYAMPSSHEDGTSRQHGAESTSIVNNALWGNSRGTMLRGANGAYQLYNTASSTSCGGSCPGSNRSGP
jgi:parallel beta-helix repeat protein